MTDPKDAEIARLNRKIELLRVYQDIVWEPPVGYWQDRAEKAEAERDAALAQTAGAYEAAGKEAAVRCAACGVSNIGALVREYIIRLIPADALAALSRRDAQMRAEGRKEGLREATKICTRGDDRAAILAAAEKEAGNG